MKRMVMKSVAIMVIALSAVLVASAATPRKAGPQIGRTAPPLMLRNLSGRMVYLSDYCGSRCPMKRRRNTVVHFFATYCKPCLDEIPAIKRLRISFAKKDLAILMISVADSEKAVINYKKKWGIKATFLLDKFAYNAKRWGITNTKKKSMSYDLPCTLLLNKNGIVRAIFPKAHKNLDVLIKSKLKKF